MQDVAIHCIKNTFTIVFIRDVEFLSCIVWLYKIYIHLFIYFHSHLFTSQLMHGTLNKLDKQTINV